MIGTALATLFMGFVAMVPGALLGRGERLSTGAFAALATASLAVAMIATALLGVGLDAVVGASLPAWALLPVSLVLTGLALWRTCGEGWHAPDLEWQGLVLAAGFALYGLATYELSVTELSDGSLRVHAWYNADWFKHVGHTFALADYGIPARDIFSGGAALHYYWLGYILPGAGTAVGGDAWTAMQVFNLLCAALLCLTFYGLLRRVGIAANFAAITVVLSIIACAPIEGVTPFFRGKSLVQVLYATVPPTGPSFLGFAHYIPQHAFALALFLGQMTMMVAPAESRVRTEARWAVLAGLSTVMTISTLFGASLLSIYGVFAFLRQRLIAVPKVAAMAVISTLLVVALGVVQLSHPAGSMESPLMASAAQSAPPLYRALSSVSLVVQNAGLPFLVCLFLAAKWKPSDQAQRDAKLLALVIVAVTLIIAFGVELAFSGRLSRETLIRLFNLPVVFVALVGGWMAWQAWLKGKEATRKMALLVAALTLFALPSTILRTVWHALPRDRFTVLIPAQDRKVLTELRRLSHPRDVVWQYPEKPFLSNLAGGDSWSVVLAGRTNLGTERATDYRAAYPAIRRAYRYFAGEQVTIPSSVNYVYLSRALHPHSYDMLLAKLADDSRWIQRACYTDACLFSRAATK